MVVTFLKGVVHLFLPVKEIIPLWDLNTVLTALLGPPSDLVCLSFCQKTDFCIAKMSIRRVSKLHALMAEPVYV